MARNLFPMNVIYIDDDATNRLVVREMLATAGIKLTEAEDGRTGLGSIREGSYDLVLMDLRMPGLNGLTAIRQLRSDGLSARRHHIVVLTGGLTAGVREMCRSAGADDFLEKPVEMGKLMDIVASLAGANDVLIH